MGEYQRKCEMGVHGGLRTRDDVEITGCLKRRKLDAVSDVDSTENSTSPAVSLTSVHIPTSSQYSSCNNDESGQVVKKSILKSLDLKADGFETDNSASFNGGFRSSENLKNCVDSGEMDSSSTTTNKSSSRKPPCAAKIAPEAEVEEFLSGAEKREQKRFAEKYNYDFVKDVPLEGRYQWVSLKP